MDENQVPRSVMTVPDEAIDRPGKIKEATQLCEEPVGKECGAEVLLRLIYNDQQQ
jgi:hypothetical protein